VLFGRSFFLFFFSWPPCVFVPLPPFKMGVRNFSLVSPRFLSTLPSRYFRPIISPPFSLWGFAPPSFLICSLCFELCHRIRRKCALFLNNFLTPTSFPNLQLKSMPASHRPLTESLFVLGSGPPPFSPNPQSLPPNPRAPF